MTSAHVGDKQEGLPSCPSCCQALEDLKKPELVLIPISLEYFIDFDLKEFKTGSLVAMLRSNTVINDSDDVVSISDSEKLATLGLAEDHAASDHSCDWSKTPRIGQGRKAGDFGPFFLRLRRKSI